MLLPYVVHVKGIIFNLVEEVVSQAHGDDAWDAVLDAAHLDGSYTSLGSYPDSDLEQLTEAAAKLYPGVVVPDFDFESEAPDVLRLGYRSQRRLCALAEGFVIGAAAHYGETVELEQLTCMHRGDDRCVIRCRFRPGA
jgi:hypothetical protein